MLLVLDATGDGLHPLDDPTGLALDSQGNLYVAGYASRNVFRVGRDSTVVQIIDAQGAGKTPLLSAWSVVADPFGRIYVATGQSRELFRVNANGAVEEVINATASDGNGIWGVASLATNATGSVFFGGTFSDNVVGFSQQGRSAEILDESGDGQGNGMNGPFGAVVDGNGVLYIACLHSNNVFRVSGLVPARAYPRNGTGSNSVLFEELTPFVIGDAWESQVELGAGATLSLLGLRARPKT